GLTAQCRAMGTYSLPAMPVQDVTEIVTWSSSDSEVASIRNSDPCGQVGWVKLGTAKITAKDPKTERVSNEFGITTVDAVLQNIEVLQSWVFERVLHTGMQQVPPNYPVEFKAYGYYSDEPRKAVAITDGANWTVPAGSDCAISANFARGTRPGVSCVVTASKDGIEHSATLKILDVVLNSILVEPTPSDLPNGMTRDFQAWGIYNVRDPLFSFGRILPYQFELTRLATWSTHDVEGTGIADVSNAAGSQGQVLAKNLGRATVQAIEPLSQISGQADLHVTDAILKEISVAPASAEIHLGEAQQFNVEATFTDGSKLDVTNSAVCHLDAVESFGPVGGSCRFQGNSQGEWTVTANYHGMTDTAAFKVSAAQLLEVEVQLCDRSQPEGDRFVFTNCRQTNSAQVMVGQNTVFRAFGRFTDTAALHGGFWEDITPFVAWDSSARDVAHVSNDLEDIGAATGLTVGESTITAVDPGRLIYASLVRTVVPALP
ncbi:MAG TPA: hypothetical protein VFL67_11115, partial [Mycobacterium sp.]|nr:hypothetical protein [Mycobacterium sp.]